MTSASPDLLPTDPSSSGAARVAVVLVAGVVAGLLEVALALSMAALVFTGPLEAYVGVGIGLALVGTIVASAVITLRTSIPGIVGGIQEAPVAIMAAITAVIAATLSATTTPERMLATVITAIALTTSLTGVVYYVLGRFSLGNFIRYLPYPVIGGFMAGTGWLLVVGGFGLMADTAGSVTRLMQPDLLMQWLPGLLLALCFLLISERIENPLAMPGLLLLSVILFWVIALIAGATPAGLSAQGWLLGPFPSGGLWQPITPALILQADLAAIASQLGNIIAVFLIGTAALLLNVSGVEVTTQQDGDLNHELRVAGIANVLAGLTGGLIVFQQLGVSILNFKLNAGSRWVGVVNIVFCGIVLFAGAGLLSLTPKLVVGGLLLYLGLSLLFDWVIKAWFRLPRIDYAIVLLILVVVGVVGFLEGVALGLLVAVVLFVVSYSRTDVVRHELSASTYRSRVTRPSSQRDFLIQHGNQIRMFELQGFLFFGTADTLLTRIRTAIEAGPADVPRFIVLDFARATGLDSTAVISFQKLQQLTDSTAVTLVLTTLPPAIQQQFQAATLLDADSAIRIMADLDQGVEWCEEQLLRHAGLTGSPPAPLRAQLAKRLSDTAVVDDLLGCFERLEIAADAYLIQQGAPADELYIIESGRLTAQLEQPGQPPLRLETMGHGRVVGELGFYLRQDRTAAVVAVEDSVVYRLTRADLARMETAVPRAASAFHHLLIRLLAERVTHLMTAVDALQK